MPQIEKVLKKGTTFFSGMPPEILEISTWRHLGIHGVTFGASGCSKTLKLPPKWSPGHPKSIKIYKTCTKLEIPQNNTDLTENLNKMRQLPLCVL